jgi:hypothetical protein
VKLARHFNLLDLVVAIVVPIAIFLPPRETYGRDAARGTEAERIALATAEARTLVRPDDGVAVVELGQRLAAAGHLDWSVEATAELGARAEKSPSRWRMFLATSIAYADRLEPKESLAWAQRALEACHAVGTAACPTEDEIRVSAYIDHLDAGVKSGIDPRYDPQGFRAAGEQDLRWIQLKGSTTPEPTGTEP